MVAAAFILNLAVLVPLVVAILSDGQGMSAVYGTDTAARRILACLYATIGLVSAIALVLMAADRAETATEIARVLFPVQIAYKLMTLAAVGWTNPVVKSNIAISVVLAAAWVTTL